MDDLSESQFQEWVREYRAQVIIPEKKGKQILLCPVGLVGAGKTTVVKPLAESLGLIRVSSDEVRKMMKARGLDYKGVEDIVFAVGLSYMDEGYGVAIDADCVRLDKKAEIERLAAERKVPVVWIHINPPEAFIINKLKQYPHTWLYKDADAAIANYQARKPLHQDLSSFHFTYTFDTSKSDLDEQIEKAREVIDGKYSS
jgi:predicted kinase